MLSWFASVASVLTAVVDRREDEVQRCAHEQVALAEPDLATQIPDPAVCSPPEWFRSTVSILTAQVDRREEEVQQCTAERHRKTEERERRQERRERRTVERARRASDERICKAVERDGGEAEEGAAEAFRRDEEAGLSKMRLEEIAEANRAVEEALSAVRTAAAKAERARARRTSAERKLQAAERERRKAEEEVAEFYRMSEEASIWRMQLEEIAAHAKIVEESSGLRRAAREEGWHRADEFRATAEDQAFLWRIQEEEMAEERKLAEAAKRRRRNRIRQCAACQEDHDMDEVVQTPCNHWYCFDCARGKVLPLSVCNSPLTLTGAVEAMHKVRQPFRCCKRQVPARMLQGALPSRMFEQYKTLLDELSDPNPVHCSNRVCGVYLPRRLASGPDEMRCAQCSHRTCRHCKGRAHAGAECPQDDDARKARALALKKGWKSCPRCSHMIERSSGCMHMTCKCGMGFCYRCGKPQIECGDRCV